MVAVVGAVLERNERRFWSAARRHAVIVSHTADGFMTGLGSPFLLEVMPVPYLEGSWHYVLMDLIS